jgi:6-pyruvoyltetrahydropterin/6-carboxytetrahydropterin synthase
MPETAVGSNSYASKPSGQGLAVFFELYVVLEGDINPATGFVINVSDIDKQVRRHVVPLFEERLKDDFRNARHIGISGICELLQSSVDQLAGRFGPVRLSQLSLSLNPFRKVTLENEDNPMLYFSEKFEFAAMHKLWNDDFSPERNFEAFGKCANPTGHGHNYVLEVTVTLPEDRDAFAIADFQRIVDERFIDLVDHKNLNVDIADFADTNPTVENLTTFAWQKLAPALTDTKLHCLTLWETDKTYCKYYGK